MSFDDFRQIAMAADRGRRPWFWRGGYPQTVSREGDAILVAETFDDPDSPAHFARFIATFDPPTILFLLDLLEER